MKPPGRNPRSERRCLVHHTAIAAAKLDKRQRLPLAPLGTTPGNMIPIVAVMQSPGAVIQGISTLCLVHCRIGLRARYRAANRGATLIG